MTIVRKIPWTSQPPPGTPLDMTHPMAKDLAFFVIFNDGANNPIDLVNNRAGVRQNNGTATLESGAGPYGRTAVLDNATGTNDQGWSFGDHPEYDLTNFSFATRAKDTGTYSGSWSRIFSKRFSATGNDVYAFIFQNTNAVHFRLGDNVSTTTDHFHNLNPTRTAGNWFDVVGFCDGTSADYQLWDHATKQRYTQLGTTGIRSASVSTGELNIGGRWQDDRWWDGEIDYVALWNTPKPLKFLEDFKKNPYQIFKPREQLIPVEVAAAQSYGVIPHKIPWTKKPPSGTRVDRSNQLAQRLKFSVVYNEGGGNPIDLVSGIRSTVGGGDPTWGIENGEVAGVYDTSADRHDFEVGQLLVNTEPFTICWRGEMPTDNVMIASLESVAGTCIYRYTGGGYEDITFGGTTASYFDTMRWSLDAPAAYNTFFIIFDGVDESLESSYRFFEGRTEQTTLGGTALSTTTNGTTLGNRRNGDLPMGGSLEFFHVFDTAFTEGMVHSFLDNSNQLFEPQTRQIPIAFDAAAAQSYGAISRQVPWTSQPPAGTPIDWSHPLAKHVAGYYNAAEGYRWNKGPKGDNTPTLALDGSHARAPFTGSPGGQAFRADDATFDTHGMLFTNGPELKFGTGSVGTTLLFGLTTDPSYTGTFRSIIFVTANATGERFSIDASDVLKWETSTTAFVSSSAHKINDGGFHTAGMWWREGALGDTAGLVSDGVLLDTSTSHANWFVDTTVAGLLDSAGSGAGDWGHDPGMPFAIVLDGVPDTDFSLQAYLELSANPWQIFQPQTRRIPVEVAAAQSYGVIPRQVPWTKQPPAGTPIDWGNPLTRGLFRANIPSGPYSVNLVSGRISAPAAGTHSTGVSRVGKVQYGSSTASQTNLNPYATDSIFKNYVDNVFTMACLVYLPDNYASPAMVFGEGVTSSSSSTSLVRTVNFTDAWEVRFRTSFAGPIIVTTDDAVDAVTGGTYLIVASLNRNAPTDKAVLDVYRLDTGAQERVTSTEDVTNDFTGYNSFAFGFGDDVGAALQLTWNRELTKAERDSLAENPWQTFQPQTRQIPITFGAAAAAQSYGVISRQVPWTKQPIPGTPLDWGNPLTEGLVACWVFNEPTDNLTDLARSHTVNTASGNLITTPQGHAHDFAGAVDRYIIDHDPDLDADADFTIVVGVTNQESGQNIEFIEKQGGNPMYQLYNNASGNRVDFHGRDSAGTLMTLSGGTGSMPVGEFVNIAGVKSVGEDWLWLYVDGELADDQQDTTTGDWSNTADLFIGDGSGSGMFNGSIHYVYIFRTAKKSSQIKSLHENPWQIFQPQTRQIIIEYDAVTGGVVITNVNTTNTWDDGDTGLIITGTGFRG